MLEQLLDKLGRILTRQAHFVIDGLGEIGAGQGVILRHLNNLPFVINIFA